MARRSSGGKATAANDAKSPDSSSVVSKLRMLREFVGNNTTWSEADLSNCLRQCGYNVDLAAERLMTGQYQNSAQFSFNGKRTSAFFAMSSPSSTTTKVTHDCVTNVTAVATTSSSSSSTVKRPRQESPPMARKKAAKGSPESSSTAKVVTPGMSQSVAKDTSHRNSLSSSPPSTVDNGPSLLLCQRWVVGCCTTKHGHVSYKEKLSVSNSPSGPPVVRFRGFSIDGTLPVNLGALLTPLLRYNNDDPTTTTTTTISKPLISIKAEGLMESRQVPIGGEVPLALSIYLDAPHSFFSIFEQENESAKGKSMSYYGKKHHSKAGNSHKMKISDTAFALLQWAEYGDVPEFKPPTDALLNDSNKPDQENSKDEEGEDDPNSLVVLKEDEMDAGVENEGDDSKKNPAFAKLLGNTTDQAALLPEMDDPDGFSDDVVLRNYQRQALHWMMNREHNPNQRDDLEKELKLLLELARNKTKLPTGTSNWIAGSQQEDVKCDCGPILVSEKAAKKSTTLDGVVDPLTHPLWHRRFLASADLNVVVSFYVNELLGTATHRPPNPPRQCVGGILADSMGLGKTVMLLALILKEKEEAAKNNIASGASLIVAPLSLVAQWEEELSTKTSLSYSIHYGDRTKSTFDADHNLDVDVVVTTYGTLQGELQTRMRKNAANTSGTGLLDYDWHRVILDEAHSIKNQATLACKACCMLKADRRWCVSGTIIQNSLDDVYALVKFLRHEPWCESGFWKASITSIMRRPESEAPDTSVASTNTESTGLNVAMDRIRRLLLPIMLRRTKDSVCKDGKPILTLPPVETSTVQVHFSPAEREFYASLLLKSQDVFEGYLKAGTVSKSWLAIFSLLQRLRQACDHVALTVKSHIDESDWNYSKPAAEEVKESVPISPKATSNETVSGEFLEDLLKKFRSKQLVTADRDGGECAKQGHDTAYAQSVAHSLTDAVNKGELTMADECPICLETPLIHDAVVTPCAHIFCRHCLIGYLNDKPSDSGTQSQKEASQSMNGQCPCCNKMFDASRIIALSQSSENGKTTSSFLGDDSSEKSLPSKDAPNATVSAREFLEKSLRGAGSSKLTAVLQELHKVWSLDPGSKVLIFSQFLGFLDLMEGVLREDGIPFGRLDGKLSLKERVKVLEDFKKSTTKATSSVSAPGSPSIVRGSVLLMSMKAGGVGINLVAASSVFIVDPWWNAAVEDQCVNRIHRIGQTASVVRVRKFVVMDSVEERIVELQRHKKGIANQVFGDFGKAGSAPADSSRPSLDDMKLIFGKL